MKKVKINDDLLFGAFAVLALAVSLVYLIDSFGLQKPVGVEVLDTERIDRPRHFFIDWHRLKTADTNYDVSADPATLRGSMTLWQGQLTGFVYATCTPDGECVRTTWVATPFLVALGMVFCFWGLVDGAFRALAIFPAILLLGWAFDPIAFGLRNW